MIIRDGLAATHLLTFDTGHPDGDIVWQVLGPDNSVIEAGTVSPNAEAVSALIPISSEANSLPSGSFISWRDLTWSYSVGGAIVNGEFRYTIEARLPLGISAEGVRQKLGVSAIELPNDQIPLVDSYLAFVSSASEDLFLAAFDGGANDIALRNAIEASAALALVPTMAVRVANTESSGTNTFKRDTVDWYNVASALELVVDAGYRVVDPLYDPTAGFGALLILASPATDPFTGA